MLYTADPNPETKLLMEDIDNQGKILLNGEKIADYTINRKKQVVEIEQADTFKLIYALNQMLLKFGEKL